MEYNVNFKATAAAAKTFIDRMIVDAIAQLNEQNNADSTGISSSEYNSGKQSVSVIVCDNMKNVREAIEAVLDLLENSDPEIFDEMLSYVKHVSIEAGVLFHSETREYDESESGEFTLAKAIARIREELDNITDESLRDIINNDKLIDVINSGYINFTVTLNIGGTDYPIVYRLTLADRTPDNSTGGSVTDAVEDEEPVITEEPEEGTEPEIVTPDEPIADPEEPVNPVEGGTDPELPEPTEEPETLPEE